MSDRKHARSWSVWGVQARVVVTDPDALDAACNLVRGQLVTADAATNRHRRDSELALLGRGDGHPVQVTPMLAEFVARALAAAELTDGAIGPTAGAAAASASLWRSIRISGTEMTVPPGIELDLSTTVRATSADRCAASIAELLGCGVLVGLGGDIATAGADPSDGWQVRIEDLPGEPACQVSVPSGCGVATASTVTPLRPAEGSAPAWRTVSVVADSCSTANAVSRAAVLIGGSAIDWLTRKGFPARLVNQEFQVTVLGGWPEEKANPRPPGLRAH